MRKSLVAAFVAGAVLTFAGVDWCRKPVEEPPIVKELQAQLDTARVKYSIDSAMIRDSASNALHRADSLQLLASSATATAVRSLAKAATYKAMLESIPPPDTTLRDSLRYQVHKVDLLQAQAGELWMANDSLTSANRLLLQVNREGQLAAGNYLSGWIQSDGLRSLERATAEQQLAVMRGALAKAIRPQRDRRLSVGLGGDAVIGGGCYATTAGPQVEVGTTGRIRLEARGTLGVGAGGCFNDAAPSTGLSGAIGGAARF